MCVARLPAEEYSRIRPEALKIVADAAAKPPVICTMCEYDCTPPPIDGRFEECAKVVKRCVDSRVREYDIWCDPCGKSIAGWPQFKQHDSRLPHCLKMCKYLGFPCPMKAQKKKNKADKEKEGG